jgi:hypothetical protein
MRGLHFLSVTALAGNDPAVHHRLDSTTTRSLCVQESLKVVIDDEPVLGRRKAWQSIMATGAVLVATTATATFPAMSTALDYEAFTKSELDKDTKNCNPKVDPKCAPEMTQDEALCKYGQSGNARGEACRRFKAAGGQLPTSATKEKSLGGAYAI